MPPKGKGGKGKGKSQGVVIDGVNTSEMTREQLEIFALRLKEELEREREERNFFQLERDKLRTYWGITRNELEEKDAELRTKHAEIQAIGERHDEEIKNFRQIIKNIKFEKQLTLASFRTRAKAAARKEVVAHVKETYNLLEEKRKMKLMLKENRARYRDIIKAAELDHKTSLCESRQYLTEKLNLMMDEFDERVEILEEGIPQQYMLMVRELEEKYQNEMGTVIEMYNDAIKEDRGYFNDIIQNNLGLMNAMKSQLDKYYNISHRQEMLLEQLIHENEEMKEPLESSKAEVQNLKSLLNSCKRKNHFLLKQKAYFDELKRTHDQLKAKLFHDRIHYGKIENYTKVVRSEFHKCVFDTKVKERLKNVILQERIKQVSNEISKRSTMVKAIQVLLALQFNVD